MALLKPFAFFLLPIYLASAGCPPAHKLVDQALDALGGEQAINDLQGVTYHTPSLYRSRSLMQSYELNQADVAVAISGSQNVSFSFASDELVQRIDRRFTPGDYWTWASPQLEPFDNSLVVRGGKKGWACYVKGNNQIWLPPDLASGYTDSALAEYFVLHGEMLSPKLLTKMKTNSKLSSFFVEINDVQLEAVHDSSSDLTVIFHPESHVPYIVRTMEHHPIYGQSTNDLYLTNYKPAHNIMFPHHVQTVYNSTTQNLDATLEDFVITEVTVNPNFPSDFFNGIPESKSFSPKVAPKRVKGITHGRITEFNSNGLWSGIPNDTVKHLKIEQPVPGLPTVHWVTVDPGRLGVKQMILEFEDGVIVCDAPPQWTDSVIKWIDQNLKKPITHLWPTHHHRDHSGGTDKYVARGVKLIVPEMAVDFWSNIPNATFVTFNETHPYVHSDSKMQAWFMWQADATHAADWSYSFITTKCPDDQSPAVVFEADAWQAGVPAEQSDQALMRQWLNQVARDGLSKDAVVLPTHGQVSPLTDLIEITGSVYPKLKTTDWKGGAAKCGKN